MDKLPFEHRLTEALAIYAKRLGFLLLVTALILVFMFAWWIIACQ